MEPYYPPGGKEVRIKELEALLKETAEALRFLLTEIEDESGGISVKTLRDILDKLRVAGVLEEGE